MLSKYYNIKTLKWFFSILCIFFGFACYAAAYNPEGFGDEIVFLLAFSFALIIYFVFWKLFEIKINDLIEGFKNMDKGEFNALNIKFKGLNEFKEIANLQKSITTKLNIVKDGIYELEHNNLDFNIDNKENYILKESLYNLQQQLIKIRKTQKEDNWINTGLAQFAEVLRSEETSINQLSKKILSNLVKYTKSCQASIYLLDQDKEYLSQVATFAYDRDKFTNEKIPKGFGLLWQCLFEKKAMNITKLPEKYIKIRSSLGNSNPKSLLLIPLILEEETFGVIELASFNEYQKIEIEFIQKLANNIAASISNTKSIDRTNKLLQDSKIKTQELITQEEEMKQNFEEMQSTQEEMHRIQEELKIKDFHMKSLLDSSSDTFFAIDSEYIILIVNKTLREKFEASNIILTEGMSIFECIPKDQHQLWKKKYDRCLKGENYIFDSEKKTDTKIFYYRAFYNPIKDNDGKVIGCSVRTTDISEFYQLSLDIMDKDKQIMELSETINEEPSYKNFISKIGKLKKELKTLRA